MKTATDEAIAAAKQHPESELMLLYLSEAPIGDEYETMTEAEWDRAGDWVASLAETGVAVWRESGDAG